MPTCATLWQTTIAPSVALVSMSLEVHLQIQMISMLGGGEAGGLKDHFSKALLQRAEVKLY
jgi:hypothetical protein